MDATTMAKTSSLVAKLRRDYPKFSFSEAGDSYWAPSEQTVYLDLTEADEATILHETAHAVLGHQAFTRDIDLLRMEREAWTHAASVLAPQYGVTIDEETVESMLDTYRDWLHARSACPGCPMTGVQTNTAAYHCVGCGKDWRVNEARRCGLKRYATT